MAIGDRA